MSVYSADMQKLFSGCRSAYSYTAFKVFAECPLAYKPYRLCNSFELEPYIIFDVKIHFEFTQYLV